MFDQDSRETAHWANEIKRGDVVLFRYPIRNPRAEETPKTRPCLVLEIDERFGTKRLTLAYGTSVPSSANRGYEIPVTLPDDMRAAGLKRATRFVGARLLSVSPDNPGFSLGSRSRSPIIGRLSHNRIERMDWIRARLHAERDIAAERRGKRTRNAPTVVRRRRKILAHLPRTAA
ncbi:MAG: hypothetical protein KDK11_00175 [Maritimibacter sp.]|nr:hypothetical protein [Maritimibacter sp.]